MGDNLVPNGLSKGTASFAPDRYRASGRLVIQADVIDPWHVWKVAELFWRGWISGRRAQRVQARKRLRAAGISGETMVHLVGKAWRFGGRAVSTRLQTHHSMVRRSGDSGSEGGDLSHLRIQFHDLTLRRPSMVWMGIERNGWKPTASDPSMRFVRSSTPMLA
jgi:hypothetical protein